MPTELRHIGQRHGRRNHIDRCARHWPAASGDDGSFALAAPAQGSYVLGARNDLAGSGQSKVVVEGDEATTGDITLTRSG